MAAYLRRTNPPLKEKLFKETYSFEFFQAVRILNHLKPNCVDLGSGADPQKESVFFKSTVSFAFTASDLATLTPREESSPILRLNFLGIAGTQGPLPAPYTHLLLERIRSRDHAFEDFLDIFNHRIISILYRIRKKYRVGIIDVPAPQSSIGQILRSFVGLGFKNLLFQKKLHVPDSALISFAGLLWGAGRSKIGLQRVLQNYFKVPVTIKDFQGKWLHFPKEQCTIIGVKDAKYNALGQSLTLGKKSWDKTGALTVKLGPLSLNHFIAFFRERPAYQSLCDLTSFYVGLDKTFDLNLSIQKKEVPDLILGQDSYLGWRTWLKTKPFEHDDSQVYVHPLKADIL